MEDESGVDEKILFVPINKLTRYYEDIKEYTQLPRIHTEGIQHFFERYHFHRLEETGAGCEGENRFGVRLGRGSDHARSVPHAARRAARHVARLSRATSTDTSGRRVPSPAS